MISIVTFTLFISLVLHTTQQRLPLFDRANQVRPKQPLVTFVDNAAAHPSSSSSSSDDTSSSSSTSTEEDISAELRKVDGEGSADVLTLVVVDNNQPSVHDRSDKLLEPYQSLGAQTDADLEPRRGDERYLRNNKHILYRNRPVVRKGEPKELFNNPPVSQAVVSVSVTTGEPQKPAIFENNAFIEELLSKHHEGLDIPEFPNVKVLPLKDSRPNGASAKVKQKEDPEDGGKTFTVKEKQLLALRKRWSYKCDKASSKACKKACKKAMKYACSDYRCKSGLKKAFKKECKRSCRQKFIQRSGCGE